MSYSTRGLALHAAGDGTTSDLSATCQEIILVSECERRKGKYICMYTQGENTHLILSLYYHENDAGVTDIKKQRL